MDQTVLRDMMTSYDYIYRFNLDFNSDVNIDEYTYIKPIKYGKLRVKHENKPKVNMLQSTLSKDLYVLSWIQIVVTNYRLHGENCI